MPLPSGWKASTAALLLRCAVTSAQACLSLHEKGLAQELSSSEQRSAERALRRVAREHLLEKAALVLVAGQHDYMWALGACYVLNAYDEAVRGVCPEEDSGDLIRPLFTALSQHGVAERLAALITTELERNELAGTDMPAEPPLWRSAAVLCAGCMGPGLGDSPDLYRAAGMLNMSVVSGCVDAVLRGVLSSLARPKFNTVLDEQQDNGQHSFAIDLYCSLYRLCWHSALRATQLRTAGLVPLLIHAVGVTALEPPETCAP